MVYTNNKWLYPDVHASAILISFFPALSTMFYDMTSCQKIKIKIKYKGPSTL